MLSTGSSLGNAHENFKRVATYTCVARLAFLLQTPHSGNRFRDDLLHIAELHVMGLQQIHVIGAETSQ